MTLLLFNSLTCILENINIGGQNKQTHLFRNCLVKQTTPSLLKVTYAFLDQVNVNQSGGRQMVIMVYHHGNISVQK